MKTLHEYILEADTQKKAIGHFNVSNLETINAIVQVVREMNVPVIIGVSEGEEDFVGATQLAGMIRGLREKEGLPIFLNADHHYSLDRIQKSISAGFDAVIIDAVTAPLEENIALTKACVAYARPHGVLVEAEIGFIGKSSKLLDTIPEGAGTLTTPEDAQQFVTATGIDLLAPSVGNIHGMVKGGNPRLAIEHIAAIRAAAGIPLVLHGGSGINDEDFKHAIQAGISIIHINTELRITYKKALTQALETYPDEIAPYKYMRPVVDALADVIRNRIKLFYAN